MVTVICQRKLIGSEDYDFDIKCLSTDEKPTQIGWYNVGVNSVCLELDTGDFYYYTGRAWIKVGNSADSDVF